MGTVRQPWEQNSRKEGDKKEASVWLCMSKPCRQRTLSETALLNRPSIVRLSEPSRSSVDQQLVLFEISKLLNTQLDKETLATCVGLIESGVNPDALAVGLSSFVWAGCGY